MSLILVFLDNDRGALSPSGPEALTPALDLASTLGAPLEVATVGEAGRAALEGLGLPGHVVSHPILSDYAPEAYGEALAQLADRTGASVLIALGDDRGPRSWPTRPPCWTSPWWPTSPRSPTPPRAPPGCGR